MFILKLLIVIERKLKPWSGKLNKKKTMVEYGLAYFIHKGRPKA